MTIKGICGALFKLQEEIKFTHKQKDEYSEEYEMLLGAIKLYLMKYNIELGQFME